MSSTPSDANDPSETPAAADAGEPANGGGEASDRTTTLEAEKRDLHDRLLRLAADFENWKKRARREQDEAASRGREALLKDILPALDNLDRALKAAPEQDPVAVGVRLVDKQILQALEKYEVRRFSALGQPFDPNVHEAIQQVASAEVAPGGVAAEFAPGYMIGQRLLRAAIVAVAKAPEATAPADNGEPGQKD